MAYQVNLYNPALLPQQHIFSAKMMVNALAAVLVGSLLLYAYELQQGRVLAQALARADAQAKQQREQLMQISRDISPASRSKALQDEITAAQALLARRKELLSDVSTGAGGNAEGFSRYLSALARRSMSGVWLTSVRIGGQPTDVVIQGRVVEGSLIPAYIQSLNRETVFAGRTIAELKLVAKETRPAAAASPAAQSLEPSRFVEFTFNLPAVVPGEGS